VVWVRDVGRVRYLGLDHISPFYYYLCVNYVTLPETENVFVFYIISMTFFLLFRGPREREFIFHIATTLE